MKKITYHWLMSNRVLLERLMDDLSYEEYVRRFPRDTRFVASDAAGKAFYDKKYSLYKEAICSLYFIVNGLPPLLDNRLVPWVLSLARERQICDQMLEWWMSEDKTDILDAEYANWKKRRGPDMSPIFPL